jgi:signal transduction histidine kinase
MPNRKVSSGITSAGAMLPKFTLAQSTEGTASEKGTSIGLMLCKAFAEENNGSIAVESTPGQGTCFKVLLPVARKVI